MLDEINLLRDPGGLAHLVKNLDCITFVLVGTAVDVRLLVQDHASIPRQIAEGQIRLHSMSREELIGILRVEERRSGGAFKFRIPAVERVVRLERPYREAAETSWKRELVLKLAALRHEDDISTTNISRLATGSGVQNPGGLVARLREAGVLERTGPTTHRFKDTRFKVFARLRPPVFDENRERVAFVLSHEACSDSDREGWAHAPWAGR